MPDPVIEATVDTDRLGVVEARRPAAVTRIFRALSAVLAAGLLYFVIFEVVIPKIQVGESHQLLLPVMFFVGPIFLLGLVPLVVLTRRAVPLPSRLLVSLAVAWLLFMVLHRVLTGTTWLWVPFNLLPPLLMLLVPLGLLVAIAWLALSGVPATRAAARWTAALAVAAAVVTADHAGVNPSALWAGPDEPGVGGQLRVVSWDTYAWDTREAERFHDFVARQDADVYLFQDHLAGTAEHPRPAADAARLRREFPGHYFAGSGELLIVSRVPIVAWQVVNTGNDRAPGAPGEAWPEFWGNRILRADLRVGDDLVSVYNVHLFDLFYATINPLSPEFFQAIQGLDARRRTQFAALDDELSRNPHPKVVSGNFNRLPSMGEMPWHDRLRDVSDVSGSVYPTTLDFFGGSMWQVDWTFVTHDIRVLRYELRDQEDLSPHKLQYLHIGLAE